MEPQIQSFIEVLEAGIDLKVFLDIIQERKRQITKFGIQNHRPIEWCAILGEEVGEVNKEALEYHFKDGFPDQYRESKQNLLKNYRKELVQVAAVAMAMIESLERNELNNSSA